MSKATKRSPLPVRVSDLKPCPDNPRSIDDEALAGLKVSLGEFGDLSGLVFNARTGFLVAGHQRLKALTEQHGRRLKLTGGSVVTPGGETFPVRVVDWPPEKARAAMVVANSPHIAGDWTAGLGALLAGLEDSLGAMFEGLRLDELRVDVPEAVPDVPVEPVTKRGDLWLCGGEKGHRVLCGDSTCAADVARLMGGEKAALCVTSPPYNIGMKYESYHDSAARKEYLDFLRAVVATIFANMDSGRYVTWNIGVSPNTYPFHQMLILEEAGLTFQRQVVWEKCGVPFPLFRSSLKAQRARHYKPNYVHEVIACFTKGEPCVQPLIKCPTCEGNGEVSVSITCGEAYETIQLFTKGTCPEYGDPIRPNKKYSGDIWKIAQSLATVNLKTVGVKAAGMKKKGKPGHALKEHPAAYPAEVPRAILSFLTSPGESALDPFLGSGTTVIAAEQLGRRAFGLEISPAYVQVSLERWAAFTGQQPVLESTGQTLDAVKQAAGRLAKKGKANG